MSRLDPRRWTLLGRFTALALTLTLGIGVLVNIVADATLHQSALDAEADAVARSISARVVPFLRPDDLAHPLTPARYAQIDQRIQDSALQDPDRVGMVLWNRDGRVVYSTDASTLGHTAKDGEELTEALAGRTMRETKDVTQTEISLQRSGLQQVMEVYVPLFLADGSVAGVFEVYHDATASDRRGAAAERSILIVLVIGLAVLLLALLTVVHGASRQLTRASRELVRAGARAEADRLQTEFVAVVSHELRTPLTAMVGFSELLLEPDVAETDRRHWTTLLHTGAERLRHLVEELLDVTRISEGRMEISVQPVDPATALRQTLQTFHPLPAGIELVDRVRPGQVPRVLADPDRLLQVLTNVVSNAVKYSPGGGRIEIDAAEAGDRVRIVVRDHGLGIPAEELSQVFERFHRVKDADRRGIEGSGLGLHIAHELVQLMNGTLTLTSDGPGTGTTAVVDLPAETGATAAPGPAAGSLAGQRRRGALAGVSR